MENLNIVTFYTGNKIVAVSVHARYKIHHRVTRKCGNCICIVTCPTSRQSFLAVFGQFYIAHAHKLLFCSFWSKFWHCH